MPLKTQQELERKAKENHFTMYHPQQFLNITIPNDIEKPFEPVVFSINGKEVCYLTFDMNFKPVLGLNDINIKENEFRYFVTLINSIGIFIKEYEAALTS